MTLSLTCAFVAAGPSALATAATELPGAKSTRHCVELARWHPDVRAARRYAKRRAGDVAFAIV
ncbi:MAG TPA: hypothetical protein VFU04_08025, partial [Solirubrobacterales bacterium]|nr:hypothetical protein [Solirubrobacterales bacterium]